MKTKIIIYISIFVVCVFLLYLYFVIALNNPRAPGRDTALSLGDGTFQILRGYDINKIEKYDLWNVFESEPIVNLVMKYRINKEKHTIYIVGKEDDKDTKYQYTVLNYKTGKYYQSFEVNSLDGNDRHVFEEIREFEIIG